MRRGFTAGLAATADLADRPARALIELTVGDEPTGNLDTVTAADMFELLERLNAGVRRSCS